MISVIIAVLGIAFGLVFGWHLRDVQITVSTFLFKDVVLYLALFVLALMLHIAPRWTDIILPLLAFMVMPVIGMILNALLQRATHVP